MSQDYNDRHTATALLASFFVVVIGVLVCVFFMLSFSNDPTKPILMTASIFLSFASAIWLLRDRPRNRTLEQKYFWLTGDRSQDKHRRYMMNLTEDPVIKVKKYGTNRPPTADEIRELSENMKHQNWTPKSVHRHEH